ncbi:MAG: AraC family transcriptional regulator [Lachnospiraceae bacterium]|nr:AraC family transcriptional regulator [Lachnospiraceae bacterium]
MNYEIVTLTAKTVLGIAARTNNQAPDMGMVIGGLWKRFYSEGIYAEIPGKVNNKALGIYTEYAGNEREDYTVMTAYETELTEEEKDSVLLECRKFAKDIRMMTIPAGKYARFIVTGDMHQAVAAAWQEIWKMDLSRSFICDFEEYQNDDMEQAEIHIYIGLSE